MASGQNDRIAPRMSEFFDSADDLSCKGVRNRGHNYADRVSVLGHQAARDCASDVTLFARDAMDELGRLAIYQWAVAKRARNGRMRNARLPGDVFNGNHR